MWKVSIFFLEVPLTLSTVVVGPEGKVSFFPGKKVLETSSEPQIGARTYCMYVCNCKAHCPGTLLPPNHPQRPLQQQVTASRTRKERSLFSQHWSMLLESSPGDPTHNQLGSTAQLPGHDLLAFTITYPQHGHSHTELQWCATDYSTLVNVL